MVNYLYTLNYYNNFKEFQKLHFQLFQILTINTKRNRAFTTSSVLYGPRFRAVYFIYLGGLAAFHLDPF